MIVSAVRTSRLAALAMVLAACAPKHARPTPGAALVHAVDIDPNSGLLLFMHSSPATDPTRVHLARHTVAGAVAWKAGVPGRHAIDSSYRPHIVGASALLPISGGDFGSPDGLLHVRLADGAMHEWLPQTRPAELVTAVGDAAQILALWHRAGPVEGQPGNLEIAAFDPNTGARTWTLDQPVHQRPSHLYVRHDEQWLLVSEIGGDWQAVRRSDGQRVPLPIVDAPGLCNIDGRWWAQRHDRLLALDLRGAAPQVQSAPATFAPEGYENQWSLVDCATAGDEVVLAVNIEPSRPGLLVGVDKTTMATRWTLRVDQRFAQVSADKPATAWPRRLGPTVVIEGDPFQTYGHGPCAVDFAARRVLWCSAWLGTHLYRDGEDTILRGHDRYTEPPDVRHYVRIRGSDASVAAAVTVDAHPLDNGDRERTTHLHGDRLWLALTDPDPSRLDAIPLLVLDSKTLQPAAPHAFGRTDAHTHVRDAMPALETIFPWTAAPPISHVPLPEHLADPWDHMFLDALPEQRPAGPRLVDAHARVFAVGRTLAGLPQDVPVRPLAWRDGFVVGYAEQHLDDHTRWTLIKAHSFDGEPPDPRDVTVRSFTRRPAPIDLDRFLVTNRQGEHWGTSPFSDSRVGVVDEAAWSDLAQAPRGLRWRMH